MWENDEDMLKREAKMKFIKKCIEFGDVKTKEDYNTHSKDETWWYAAIDSMVEAGIDHNYSCSYDVPEKCYWPIKED